MTNNTTTTKDFRVFITNLGKYNEGELVGKWLDLPCDDLEEELASIGVKEGTRYEEYFITDYENDWNYNVGEYENLTQLNELAKQLEEIDDKGDGDWLAAYMEVQGGELEYAIEHYEDSVFYPGMSLEDVAYDIVENCYDLPEIAQRYFDYEAFARDLGFDGYTETEHGTICIN